VVISDARCPQIEQMAIGGVWIGIVHAASPGHG
jgi:hypothetical protein